MWLQTSEKFCLYGDILFDPKAVCFAVTGDQFWAYAKPFGMYITGNNAPIGRGKIEDYFSSPMMLLDFLEPLDSACDDVSMSDFDGSNNVLICSEGQSCIQKKIFIGRCDRIVRKIEYYNCPDSSDKSEKPALIVELGEYKNMAGTSFSFPHKLIYKYYQGKACRDSMRIKFDSVKPWQSQPEQVQALFSPPDANSFEKIYERKEIN